MTDIQWIVLLLFINLSISTTALYQIFAHIGKKHRKNEEDKLYSHPAWKELEKKFKKK